MTGVEQDRQWSGWMAAAQDGDNAAYARLLREILPFLRVLARRRCRDPDRCEDIVQDVLLTLHRVRHTYDPVRPFSPWLAAICDRRSIDALRKRVRQNARETQDERAYETFADPAANKDVEAGDAARALAVMVAELPPGQREALELLKVKEMSLLEASAVSGQSVGALKVSVHRAIKALRLRAGISRMNTDDLIAQLSASATPVKRLAAPMPRALVWLAVVGAISAAAILLWADLGVFVLRAAHPRMALELFATLATGVAGVIAAFHLSIPDRSRAWALLPAPFAALWMATTGVGCWLDWAEQTQRGWAPGQSFYCFKFLLSLGVPLAGLLLFSLRRARPLQPRLVAAMGAIGVSGLAAFVLQFFHPFDVTIMDLGTHLAALAILIGVFTVSGRGLASPGSR